MQQHVPPAPPAPPLWGAPSDAGTPHPAPTAVGGTGPVLDPPCSPGLQRAPHAAEAPALTRSQTGLTWRPALSSHLPRVGPPPQGGVHPRVGCACAAGQGHRNRLSHLAQPALPRRDLCRQPPDAREELCRIQGLTVTKSPPRHPQLSPQPPRRCQVLPHPHITARPAVPGMRTE